jgi:TetR/AcrR family transcriptional regulator, mexJK operon transcriptional repressor
MPRLAGQIDLSKNEAILDAAVEVMVERGVGASMEEIARRACVSKQTIYNHYGSKAELVRALTERRVDEVTATLQGPAAAAHPAEALAGYARSLLQSLLRTKSTPFMRMAIASVAETPELARAMYEAGPRASRRRLADFLAMETAAGRLPRRGAGRGVLRRHGAGLVPDRLAAGRRSRPGRRPHRGCRERGGCTIP